MGYLDPPEEYDFPYCQDTQDEMGYGQTDNDREFEQLLKENCARCPRKHRCRDSMIKGLLNEHMVRLAEEQWAKDVEEEKKHLNM
jgi:hypothetical protein